MDRSHTRHMDEIRMKHTNDYNVHIRQEKRGSRDALLKSLQSQMGKLRVSRKLWYSFSLIFTNDLGICGHSFLWILADVK